MNIYEQKKLVQIVLYILNKTDGIDYYHLFKILYFAELKHLSKWGCRMTSDNFCALKYGPVPSELYDAVKGNKTENVTFSDVLSEAIAFAGDDAPNVLLPKSVANMNFISKSEKEALDSSIEENAQLTFGQLKSKSHDDAWYEAFHYQNGTNIISPISMAKVMGADEATIEYINEQLELETALV